MGRWSSVCSMVVLGCTAPATEAGTENDVATCADGRDNDADGLIDCFDAGCWARCDPTGCADGEEWVDWECVAECQPGEERVDRECVAECQPGEERVAGECVAECQSGEERVAGECAAPCQQGEDRCGVDCFDLHWDAANCGDCDRACPFDLECVWGSCELRREPIQSGGLRLMKPPVESGAYSHELHEVRVERVVAGPSNIPGEFRYWRRYGASDERGTVIDEIGLVGREGSDADLYRSDGNHGRASFGTTATGWVFAYRSDQRTHLRADNVEVADGETNLPGSSFFELGGGVAAVNRDLLLYPDASDPTTSVALAWDGSEVGTLVEAPQGTIWNVFEDGGEVRFIRFLADGSVVGKETAIGTGSTPFVEAGNDRVVIVWRTAEEVTMVSSFGLDGAAFGIPFVLEEVNLVAIDDPDGEGMRSSSVASTVSGIVVAWTEAAVEEQLTRIRLQAFSWYGDLLGPEIEVEGGNPWSGHSERSNAARPVLAASGGDVLLLFEDDVDRFGASRPTPQLMLLEFDPPPRHR